MTARTDLADTGEKLRVLVVEDELAIAMMIEDMLTELGHDIAGVAFRLPDALELAENAPIDMAVLDLNLNGKLSFPVADVLAGRNVPFLFATGYGALGVESAHARRTVISKPFDVEQLRGAIARALDDDGHFRKETA